MIDPAAVPHRGVIINWLQDRGFGFIRQPGGEPDVFLHHSVAERCRVVPVVGMRVRFALEQDNRGRLRVTATRDQSSRWQKLAAVPQDEFEPARFGGLFFQSGVASALPTAWARSWRR